MLNDPSCLDRFGVMLAGVGAAAAVGAAGPVGLIGGVAIAAGAIQLGCGGLGLLLERLRGRRSDAPAVIERHMLALKRDWQEWSGISAMRDPQAQRRAVECFEAYFAEARTGIAAARRRDHGARPRPAGRRGRHAGPRGESAAGLLCRHALQTRWPAAFSAT